MNTLIGKVVLFLGILWLAICLLATVVFILNPESEMFPAYRWTMALMIIIGTLYTMCKLAEWMDWPKGSPPYLSIQIKRREEEQGE